MRWQDLGDHGKLWYFSYTDANGKRHECKGCGDRRETEAMAGAVETDISRVRAGLADAKDLSYRDHEDSPLTLHLAAWQADLVARGSTVKHADHTSNRARWLVAVILGSAEAMNDHRLLKPEDQGTVAKKIAEAIDPARLSSLTREKAQDAIARLQSAGWSLQTCNHYRASIRAFSKWCHESHGRGKTICVVSRGTTSRKIGSTSAPISLEELHRLIKAAEDGPDRHGDDW